MRKLFYLLLVFLGLRKKEVKEVETTPSKVVTSTPKPIPEKPRQYLKRTKEGKTRYLYLVTRTKKKLSLQY